MASGEPSLEALLQLSDEMGRQRWRLVSDVAQVVANYLRCHPRVEAVRYPGLKDDPLFDEAARTLVGGFGPHVAYRVAGEWRRLDCGPVDAKELVLQLERSLASPQLSSISVRQTGPQ